MGPEHHARIPAVAIAGMLLIGACDSSPVAPPVEPNADAAFALASLAAMPGQDGAFELTCPAGGRIVGTGTGSFEQRADVSVRTWNHIATYEDCAVQASAGVVSARGEMHLTGEVHFPAFGSGQSGIVFQESHQGGTITMTHGSRVTTCEYDMHHTFNRDTGRYRIHGIACGRAVDMTMTPPTGVNS